MNDTTDLQVKTGTYYIDDFEFDSGDRLETVRIYYRTLGQLRRGADGRAENAVLIMHGTGGSGEGFLRPQFADELFRPGQLLDIEKHFVILPDGIGHGGSSKPSDRLRAGFPKYGYHDMVRAQHLLVTEHLGVDHLRLVAGTSMGGMHTWMWGYLYPQMMDALMPLASVPGPISGRNRMTRRMIIDAIRQCPEYCGGDYDRQPAGLRHAVHALLFMVSVPLLWHHEAPTIAAADKKFDELVARYMELNDANDMVYHFAASEDYDPSPHLEKITAPLLAINSADDQVNPPELGVLEAGIERVANGRAVILPISEQTRGHGTHSWPAIWKDELVKLLSRNEVAD